VRDGFRYDPYPVSYTHLDVYKRQPYDRLVREGLGRNPPAEPTGG